MSVVVIPMLPCADIDEISDFYTPMGFAVTWHQMRPNPYLGLEGHGFPLHYYGLTGHLPEESHSTFGIQVDDPLALFEAFAEGLRSRYGRLPVAGFPRITRPRPRKNVAGHTGFSLVDPAGNWLRVFAKQAPTASEAPESGAAGDGSPVAASPLRNALLNAIVLADSADDVAQAAKILRGAVRRAAPDDPAMSEAVEFLVELDERIAAESS